MRFSLSPPPPKAIFSSNVTPAYRCSSDLPRSVPKSQQYHCQNNNITTINSDQYNMQRNEDASNSNGAKPDEETSSDYKQWLHAMKLVARLPGGIPPEFRRKLWLSLADKYLKSKNVDWAKEEEKCFCEKWREDDEELGIQIVKDLHRTGSNLCTGPAGDINQAKLKRILLGYARYNPEVGYCQGFNMLGALILQVMDKEESESIKVMIYLVEGILPTGYFCGSMGGLQADMAVFRELMQTKLPRLAKHLQKLQGPIENAYEPPLTNVFTMQWFLTMFCTCLPMSCVLRVWDLVLIEGSDVLLRTALALWSLLEERVLSTRSADDFYGKMGSFSSELLNGHLIDSNGLIEKVVQLGPISDIQKLRDKHLYNIAPLKNQQGLHLYYDDDEPDMDEDSRLAVATVWGIPWGRRGSQGQTSNVVAKQATENKDRIALDISLLKKQYDRLRERQKQAHIILTTACSTARQGSTSNTSIAPLPVNQLLSGRPAIVTNKGRRSGPPTGAIPPARKPSLPAVLHDKPLEKHLRRGETLHWRDTSDTSQRRDSLTWKEIKAERKSMINSGSVDGLKSQKIRTRRLGKSDSSSYSEESDDNGEGDGSSTDTSLCDDENPSSVGGRKKLLDVHKSKKVLSKHRSQATNFKDNVDRGRPKSWAPSNSEIPFVLMTIDSPNNSADEKRDREYVENTYTELLKEGENSATESEQMHHKEGNDLSWKDTIYSPVAGDLANSKLDVLPIESDTVEVANRSDDEQEENAKLATTKTTKHFTESTNSLGSAEGEEDEVKMFDVSDEGVTNEYFERVNSTERPTKLDLLYSLNEEESIRDAYKTVDPELAVEAKQKTTFEHETVADKAISSGRCMDLLVDYSEKSSAACIAEAKTEISTTLQPVDINAALSKTKELISTTDEFVFKRPKATAAEKRRDPRRLTITRSSTMDIEKRYQALEKRLSMEVNTTYKPFFGEADIEIKDNLRIYSNSTPKDNELTSTDETKIKTRHLYEKEDLIHHLENPDVRRSIPSTADLEQRFKNMQLHLVPSDRTEKITSPCDSENSGQQKNGESRRISTPENTKDGTLNGKTNNQTDKEVKSNGENDKTDGQKTHIRESAIKNNSSTSTEIEETNEKIGKVKSPPTETDSKRILIDESHPPRSKKEPPDDKDSSSAGEKNNENTSPKGSDAQISEISKEMTEPNCNNDVSAKTNVHIDDKNNKDDPEVVDENTNSKEKEKKSSLERRVSSTETGEKELIQESRKSSQVHSADTTDQEDNISKVNVNKDLAQKSSSTDNKPAHRKSPPSPDELEKPTPRKSPPSTEELEKPAHRKSTPSTDESEKPTRKSPPSTEELEKPAHRKSPPSTEELEKRFSALEKRMSITKQESNDAQNNAEAERLSKVVDRVDVIDNEGSSLDKTKKDCDEKHNTVKEAESSETDPKLNTDDLDKSKSETTSSVSKEICENCTKRRLSEPPSTEDLEKRYEVLKRRMSSRNFETKPVTKGRHFDHFEDANNDRLLEFKKEEVPSKSSPPSIENLEKRYEELQSKSDRRESNQSTSKQSPPSTENLEKRYEELQSKTDKNETNNATTFENSPNKHSPTSAASTPKKTPPPTDTDLENHYDELPNTSDKNEAENMPTHDNSPAKHSPTLTKPLVREPKNGDAKKTPPTTDELEKRYEELQNKSDKHEDSNSTTNEILSKQVVEELNNTTNVQTPPSADILKKEYEERQDKSENKEIHDSTAIENSANKKLPPPGAEGELKDSTKPISTNNSSINDTNQNKAKLVQELEAKIKTPVLDGSSRQKRTALFEELQTKLQANSEGEQVKPSSIKPSRRAPAQNILLASRSFNDETSETHAASAYSRSGKYEPGNSSNRRMVRRFSDLPSRADLENRLQFLEEQLSKTLSKQRRSSDSEVASKPQRSRHNITLNNVPLSKSLEYRVQELEKHLKAKRTVSAETSQSKEKHPPDPEIEVSQIELAADTIAVTGKELVRYSQFGEVADFDHQNPINISINIQMTLNKDDVGSKNTNDLPKSEELDRRLQALEQQLKTPQSVSSADVQSEEAKSSETVENTNENTADATQTHEKYETNVEAGENIIESTSEIGKPFGVFDKNYPDEEVDPKTVENHSIKDADDSKTDGDIISKDKECIQPIDNSTTLTIENNVAIESKINDDLQSKVNQGESESGEQTTTESKKIDDQNAKDDMNKDQYESKIEQNETKIVLDYPPQMKTEKMDVSETVSTDEARPNNEGHKSQNESQSKTENDEIVVNKATDLNAKEVNEQDTLEAITHKNVITDLTSKTVESSQMVPIEVNKKTLVLLLDNEPKAVKVRRLTRANTEELEDLFQALEKQLSERSQDKSNEQPKQSNDKTPITKQMESELTQAMADLTKEIHDFSISERANEASQKTPPTQKAQSTEKKQEDFDWGIDPVKYHLKKQTVYLPSTKELETRFRALERQMMLLEDVEKIDVEQRLTDIDRKIKLQYSLSHEKDLNKFLELCEGKGLDDVSPAMEKQHDCSCNLSSDQKRLNRSTKHTSPSRCKSSEQKYPSSSTRHTSPGRSTEPIPSTGNLEYRYRALDLKSSKQNLKKQPIHPLEMLLDPSPDDSNIPTTGELEHRMRVMEEQRYTPSPPSRKSRSQSPPHKQQYRPTTSSYRQETTVTSPNERGLPTADELEARLDALQREQCFNFKMQKNFQQFNQKLKDVITPSLSFEDIKSGEAESKYLNRSSSPKPPGDTVSSKTIRFRDEERIDSESMVSTNNDVIQILEENSKIIQRILKKPIADTQSNIVGSHPSSAAVHEGLGVMGIRLMRETSPLRRKGTHTGVPLRTGANINDQVTSIRNTIKSIDSLCEEKPYRNERCQQYIDALFSDSTYFATKKSSLDDLTTRNTSRSASREVGPSIRISEHSPAFVRSMGSADSIRSSSPLRPTSPLQYRSNRDLRREPSPRRRLEEDREEHESRVRRDNLLPNTNTFNHSTLSHSSHSLTKFHKVDSQLIPNDIDVEHELEERSRHPTFSSVESMVNHDNNTNTSNTANTTKSTFINAVTTSDTLKSNILDRPISPYRQTGLTNSNTPVYTPAKLEIRHTTVTSTFYDRVLTEKQLEKQQSVLLANRSPMVSPLFERQVSSSHTTNKSPPKLLPYQESANTMIISDASTGNYRMYQPSNNIHANNDG